MKGTTIICMSIAIMTLLSCSSISNNARIDKVAIEKNSMDSVVCINDSVIESIILSDSIVLYGLYEPILESDTISVSNKCIAGYSVKDSILTVTKDMEAVLKFVVGDQCTYICNYPSVKQRFLPYIAIGFHRKNDVLYFLISFGTEEIALAAEDAILQTYQIEEWRLLTRWFSQVLPNDEYVKLINTQQE